MENTWYVLTDLWHDRAIPAMNLEHVELSDEEIKNIIQNEVGTEIINSWAKPHLYFLIIEHRSESCRVIVNKRFQDEMLCPVMIHNGRVIPDFAWSYHRPPQDHEIMEVAFRDTPTIYTSVQEVSFAEQGLRRHVVFDVNLKTKSKNMDRCRL